MAAALPFMAELREPVARIDHHPRPVTWPDATLVVGHVHRASYYDFNAGFYADGFAANASRTGRFWALRGATPP